MQSVYRESLYLLLMSLVTLLLICIFVAISGINIDLVSDLSLVPRSSIEVFAHNLLFSAFYLLPIVGFLHYLGGFIFIFFLFALSIVSQGVLFTLFRMIHLPIELFSFAIPLVISNRHLYGKEKLPLVIKFKLMTVSLVLLFVAAMVEVSLR